MGATNSDIRDQVRYTEDGRLFWVKCRKKCQVGTECGFVGNTGYRYMKVGRLKKPVHHVVWFLHTGEWPKAGYDIDHINRNKLDNRIENLREVPRNINSLNNSAANVCKNNYGFRARVCQITVGNFKTREEAETAAKIFKDALLKERIDGYKDTKGKCGHRT